MKKRVAIVGGGISGLSALHYLKTLDPECDAVLYEGSGRLGGVIGSDNVGGYLCEWGPNGILDRHGAARELCEALGMEESIEYADENAKNRFILRDGILRAVPMSFGSFISTKLIPASAKLRILREPFTSSAKDDDESIYNFAERHFGREVAEYLIQPMVTGIYAGQAERLSVKSCFPLLHELDKESGSLIRGMISRQIKKRKQSSNENRRKGSMRLLSVKPTGVNSIIDALGKRYFKYINLGKRLQALTKLSGAGNTGEVYELIFEDGMRETANEVILALPAYSAGNAVKNMAPGLTATLEKIPYAPITVVCYGAPLESTPRALDGFGFLIPPKEQRSILGAIWSSSIFTDRAPEGKCQLRILLGGAGATDVAGLSDEETLTQVKKELRDIMGITGEPEMTKIYRWKRAIPQYTLGHPANLEKMESELSNIPGLSVTGNAYYGIGVSECLMSSERVAQKVVDRIKNTVAKPVTV